MGDPAASLILSFGKGTAWPLSRAFGHLALVFALLCRLAEEVPQAPSSGLTSNIGSSLKALELFLPNPGSEQLAFVLFAPAVPPERSAACFFGDGAGTPYSLRLVPFFR